MPKSIISFLVAALYQFGFQVDTGFAIKSHIRQGTGDWLGPYNVILAEVPGKKYDEEYLETQRRLELEDNSAMYVSRLVQTASSQYVKPPPGCNVVSGDQFDEFAGLSAIQHSIKTQTSYPLDLSKDPYEEHLGTCDNGYLEPVLPRFTIKGPKQFSSNTTTTATASPPKLEFSLRYPILSLPYKGNSLTGWWPTLQKRLTKPNIIKGPYCFDGDLKAYTIDLNFNKQGVDPAWQFVKGCVDGLPCFHDTPTGNGGNHPGIPDATSTAIFKWTEEHLGAPGLIALLVLLVVSLICNLRLCCKIRAKRRQLQQVAQSPTTRGDEEAGRAGATTATTTPRQRRQVIRTPAARSTPANRQQVPPEPRSAQILTPSRLVRTTDPPTGASSELQTPLLPKKNDPSAPPQPSMDRTPAPQNAPMGGKMDRTPIVAKAGAPKKDGGPKESSSATEEKPRK